MSTYDTSVCVAGGGPAGLFTGLLLARAGIDVVVLEKHDDFLRDFRGDTIHPTTLDLLDDLGLTDALRATTHTEIPVLDAVINHVRFPAADFRRVGRSGALWFMPQWDLLNILAEAGAAYPNFTLLTGTEATELRTVDDRVAGVEARSHDGPVSVTADLVVAADGRGSRLRECAGLDLINSGVALDVLWFRVDRPEITPPDAIAYVSHDAVFTVPRTDYYQCAFLILKGRFSDVKSAGLERFRQRVVDTVPFLEPTISGVQTWDDVHVLDVQIAHAPRWHRPGFIMIGDASHPMSPAFGVGINYAVQDAVATARVVASAPDIAAMSDHELQAIQDRRLKPTRKMQRVQQFFHRTISRPGGALPPQCILKPVTTAVSPLSRNRLGRLVGAGFAPEHLDFPTTGQ